MGPILAEPCTQLTAASHGRDCTPEELVLADGRRLVWTSPQATEYTSTLLTPNATSLPIQTSAYSGARMMEPLGQPLRTGRPTSGAIRRTGWYSIRKVKAECGACTVVRTICL